MRGVLTLTSEGSNGESSCLEVRFRFLVERVDSSVDELRASRMMTIVSRSRQDQQERRMNVDV